MRRTVHISGQIEPFFGTLDENVRLHAADHREMKIPALSRLFYSPIPSLASVLLGTLVWSNVACHSKSHDVAKSGEVHDVAQYGDHGKAPAYSQDNVNDLILKLSDKYANVQWRAAHTLEQIGTPAVEPLISVLKNHKDSHVREIAATSLGRIKDARVVEALISALKDKDAEVRCTAAMSLGEIRDARAVEPLISALKNDVSSKVSVRGCAADALGKINDARAVEPLISALKDKDSVVRLSAVWPLEKTNDARAAEPLISALKDENSAVRALAARALGTIKDARAVQPLISALKDENVDVQVWAAWALLKIGTPHAQQALTEVSAGHDLEAIAVNYSPLIRKGETGAEIVLMLALEKYGDTRMAQDLLNCGNPLLHAVVVDWADERGITIATSLGVTSGPQWGKLGAK